MAQDLEMRVEILEKKVSELAADPNRIGKKDWRRTMGIFKNDSDFEEATRLGQEYRRNINRETEIAGS